MMGYRKHTNGEVIAIPSTALLSDDAILVNHGPPYKGHMVMMPATRHRLECGGHIVTSVVLNITSTKWTMGRGLSSLDDERRVRCIDLLASGMRQPWVSKNLDAVKSKNGDEMAAALSTNGPGAAAFTVECSNLFEGFGAEHGMPKVGSYLLEERQGGGLILTVETNTVRVHQALQDKDPEVSRYIRRSAIAKYLLELPSSSENVPRPNTVLDLNKKEGSCTKPQNLVNGILITLAMHGPSHPVHSIHTAMIWLAWRKLELCGYRVMRQIFAITSREHLVKGGIEASENRDRIECLGRACKGMRNDSRHGSADRMPVNLYLGIVGSDLAGTVTASRYRSHLCRGIVVIGRECHTDDVRYGFDNLCRKGNSIEPIVLILNSK